VDGLLMLVEPLEVPRRRVLALAQADHLAGLGLGSARASADPARPGISGRRRQSTPPSPRAAVRAFASSSIALRRGPERLEFVAAGEPAFQVIQPGFQGLLSLEEPAMQIPHAPGLNGDAPGQPVEACSLLAGCGRRLKIHRLLEPA
jgi:hypothetical protein